MTPDYEAALEFDLFEGDFGEPGDTCLSNKIVTCRTVHTCHICAGGIQPGEKARSSAWVFSGELLSYYCCAGCLDAMAKSVKGEYDEDDPIEARYSLGNTAREVIS